MTARVKVYVAGGSKEPDRCRAAMDYVRELGGEITCDWLAEIERVGSANDGLSDEQRRASASADFEGIRDADVFWLLAPESASTGAWVELGYAMAHQRHRSRVGLSGPMIIVSGPARTRSIFSALADHEFASDITAARHVGKLTVTVTP